jgi:predicted SprT family Zn-dependent metalloprotease
METLILEKAWGILTFYQVKAKTHFNFKAIIKLQIDLKGHRLIGQCRKIAPNHYTIRLHHDLALRYGEIYLHDVIAHELAHAIVMEQIKYRVKPHGKEYKATLSILEDGYITPKNRPKYEIKPTKRQMKRYMYSCDCKNRTHKLSAIRHNRIKRGSTLYTCKYCKGFLYYSE